MPFSFLHISDLHFDKELSSDETFRKKIKDIIKQEDLKADCLIISGDLFNRGRLEQEEVKKIKKFLEDIPGRAHTIVVPGNHDLDRSAQKAKEGSYNVFLTRRKLVLEKGDLAATGQFEIEEDEREILYKGAYGAFFAFSSLMGFESYNENSILKDADYEVQMHDTVNVGDFPCNIIFVLLNTSLIAGQAIRGKDFREKRNSLKDEIKKKKAVNDVIGVAKKQVELAELQERYVDDGELIIDEDPVEQTGGRLSLSVTGLGVLNNTENNIKSTGTELVIFVGHHGYQFLSLETKMALQHAMEYYKSGIYLCGHAHRAQHSFFLIGNNTTPRGIDQIQAGVMFKDEGGYTQYGFNHGVFVVNDSNKIECKVTSYYLIKSASDKLLWTKETINVPLYGINLPPQIPMDGKTQSIDPEEKEGNCVDPLMTQLPDPPPPIPPTPPENTSSQSGPASTGELRRLIKNLPPEGEQNGKEK